MKHKECAASGFHPYLGPLDAAEPEIPVLAAGAQALDAVLLLQMLQGAEEAGGGAVEEAAAHVEGEQEAAGVHQFLHPGRHVPPAQHQHILHKRPAVSCRPTGIRSRTARYHCEQVTCLASQAIRSVHKCQVHIFVKAVICSSLHTIRHEACS